MGSYGSLFLCFLLLTAVVILPACGKTTSGYIEPSTIVTSLRIVSLPDKTVYAVGELFDPRGLVVEGRYADGRTRPVPMENLSFRGFDSSGPVDGQVITLLHGGYSAQFSIDVRAQE